MEYYVSSVIGTTHLKDGRPCQDAFRISTESRSTVMAISDGHGGNAYCRSDTGASIACTAAAFAVKTTDHSDLPLAIKRAYDFQVQNHLSEHPLNDEERALLGENAPHVAYGATLLLTVIGDNEVKIIQLGDGEIHVLGANGRFLTALPEDEDCYNNFTSSLCYPEEEALNHFRILRYEEKPAAILMFSDGYKSPYSRPYKLATAVVNKRDVSAVIKEGKHGDDQTVLIAYDNALLNSDEFVSGFAKTIADGNAEIIRLRTEAQKKKLEEDILACEEFLRLARDSIEKDRMNGEAERAEMLEEFCTKKDQTLALLKERLEALSEHND